jgi:hypothetical protein
MYGYFTAVAIYSYVVIVLEANACTPCPVAIHVSKSSKYSSTTKVLDDVVTFSRVIPPSISDWNTNLDGSLAVG